MLNKQQTFVELQKQPYTRKEIIAFSGAPAGTVQRWIEWMDARNLLWVDKTRRAWTYRGKENFNAEEVTGRDFVMDAVSAENTDILRRLLVWLRQPGNIDKYDYSNDGILPLVTLYLLDSTAPTWQKQNPDIKLIQAVLTHCRTQYRAYRIIATIANMKPHERNLAHFGFGVDSTDNEWIKKIQELVLERFSSPQTR